MQKCGYCENEKSFLDEIESIFHIFSGLSFGEKNFSVKLYGICQARFDLLKKTM